MNTIEKLIEVYCDNFVAYYRAHSSHLNITGRTFGQDHQTLNKIYSDMQENIDTIGELVRACGEKAPETISDIIMGADLSDDVAGTDATSDDLLAFTLEALEHLIETYHELSDIATAENYPEIQNFAADRIRFHKKSAWMIKATLSE